MKRIFHPLDRYVFAEFFRVFIITALGFPLLVEILDLAENIDKYLGRNLPRKDIALSYLYWLPESMFLVLPAAVLFATVFTIGALTRHSEITAAKASGISFRRIILPILLGAVLATGAGLGLGELVPIANRQRAELLQENRYSRSNAVPNLVFLAQDGRTYTSSYLRADTGVMLNLFVEKLSVLPEVPPYSVLSKAASYDRVAGYWKLEQGVMQIREDSVNVQAFSFASMDDRNMTEPPSLLREDARAPDDMGFRQLGNYIRVMERTGADVNLARVERMLKIAIPMTCFIIVLFGAPLATSTQRGGAAFGIGISLATTVVFLLAIQLTKAFGGKGILQPDIAAWIPGMIFGTLGLIMLIRVRT